MLVVAFAAAAEVALAVTFPLSAAVGADVGLAVVALAVALEPGAGVGPVDTGVDASVGAEAKRRWIDSG